MSQLDFKLILLIVEAPAVWELDEESWQGQRTDITAAHFSCCSQMPAWFKIRVEGEKCIALDYNPLSIS